MKNNKKKQVFLTLIAVLSLVLITVGVSYSLFTYSKTGVTDNIVKTGRINFLYTEVSGIGKGISLTDAFPISDEEGKLQTGEGKVFDFKITSTIEMNSSISYEVTARKKSDSTLDEDKVKLYLTEIDGNEQEILLDKYSNLIQTNTKVPDGVIEKTIYEGEVPANTNYEKNFRLRMWLDNDTDFSDGSMNNKTFTITVNVYANGKVVTIPENTTYNFDYTGSEQIFVVPATGKYKLETWGSQGGDAIPYDLSYKTYIGGYGGYSTGEAFLNKGDILYINVGEMGKTLQGKYNENNQASYNGGGKAVGSDGYGTYSESFGNGGGATHIAKVTGLLSTLSNKNDDILIVSGAGGGASYYNNSNSYVAAGNGGSAGGYIGANSSDLKRLVSGQSIDVSNQYGKGATQFFDSSSGGKFGLGADSNFTGAGQAGGGSGFYGGGNGSYGGGGGSSYIANPLLTNKVMYCYNCQESTEEQTKTISTTCTNKKPTENCSKQGNGYAKITYLGR